MKVYQNWEEVRHKYQNVVMALGNFDGVHLGHQQLIGQMVAKAGEIGGTPLVFTFYPHPMAVLRPESVPPMLLSQEAKQDMIAAMGVEVMVRASFTREFSAMLPEEFVSRILCDALQTRWVFVGYNYSFGYKGQGTPSLLQELGQKHGFNVHITPSVSVDGEAVSSTLIRQHIRNGNIAEARKFLGYCPRFEGNVVLGERRGRTLGFPTANLAIDDRIVIPPKGVYSVKAQVDNDNFLGVANIGTKPTFHGTKNKQNIEVHLLDFFGDLYGKKIKVFFTRHIRSEKRFASVNELVDQIKQDILLARAQSSD
ncbi:MAG: bifunctional riboflavin kinase/FAD synthetase [Firmicutes bacterium]|nr:bifunctional riboflavin kinase/FAD synthetase [Bacillota bacterium]